MPVHMHNRERIKTIMRLTGYYRLKFIVKSFVLNTYQSISQIKRQRRNTAITVLNSN